jgi:hypothetical protein
MILDTVKCSNGVTAKMLDEELSAPIANNADLEDWLDFIMTNNDSNETKLNSNFNNNNSNQSTSTNTTNSTNFNKNRNNNKNSNLTDCIDMCNSLEDLVKTFDQNVKVCLTNYKDIDVGQMAPVQVRSQEDIINDSQ